MSDADELLERALNLPSDDREHLAHELFVSLRDELRLEHEQAWSAEVDRRIRQVERGEVEMVAASEAMGRARAALAKVRG